MEARKNGITNTINSVSRTYLMSTQSPTTLVRLLPLIPLTATRVYLTVAALRNVNKERSFHVTRWTGTWRNYENVTL